MLFALDLAGSVSNFTVLCGMSPVSDLSSFKFVLFTVCDGRGLVVQAVPLEAI